MILLNRIRWGHACARVGSTVVIAGGVSVVFFMLNIRIIFNDEAMTIDFAMEHTDRI